MKHDECPLCRADYLKVSDDDRIVDLESGVRLELEHPDPRPESNPNSPPLQPQGLETIEL